MRCVAEFGSAVLRCPAVVAPIAEVRSSSVLQRLWNIYARAVLPLERKSAFHHFHLPPITAEEMEARPQVLLIGPYSAGKSSVIRWLTGIGSPHLDIRPQPSTDKFIAIVRGQEECVINGTSAISHPRLHYQGLSKYGSKLLSKFQVLTNPAEILQELSIVDTPGFILGVESTTEHEDHFVSLCLWMAQRSDLILIVFDVHKLDVSDDLKKVVEALRPYRDRVRCVLNKADLVDAENLVRVYGALLWNLGQVFQTPEVPRVLMSSFWDRPYQQDHHAHLFDADKQFLLAELQALPDRSITRKINDMIGRIRLLTTHYSIASHLRSQLPLFMPFGAGSTSRKKLLQRLPELLLEARHLHDLSSGNMPNYDQFKRQLEAMDDVSGLPSWDEADMEMLDHVVVSEISELLASAATVTAPTLRCKEPLPEGRLNEWLDSWRQSFEFELGRRWKAIDKLLANRNATLTIETKLLLAVIYLASLGLPMIVVLSLYRAQRHRSSGVRTAE